MTPNSADDICIDNILFFQNIKMGFDLMQIGSLGDSLHVLSNHFFFLGKYIAKCHPPKFSQLAKRSLCLTI